MMTGSGVLCKDSTADADERTVRTRTAWSGEDDINGLHYASGRGRGPVLPIVLL